MTKQKGATSAATTPAAAPAPTPSAPEIRLVTPPAAPAAAATERTRVSRAATPRRISAEVVKAETRLIDLERRREASIDHHLRTWADKRMTLIASFPEDVRAALVAMGILEPNDEPVNSNGSVNAESTPAVAPAEPSGAATAREANEPPLPDARASAAAPEGAPVDLVELHEALAQLDSAWTARGLGKTVLATWTEAQRREALTWASACIDDGPMAVQSRRPAHTFIGARPLGED